MTKAIDAKRNKEMDNYKAFRVFNVPQTKLERYVKDRQRSSSGIVKTKLGRKQVLSCDEAEHSLLMDRKFFGLTAADVMCLAYQIPVRNGIKNQFCKKNETPVKFSYVVIHKFQFEHLKVFLSQERGVSL